MKPTALLFLPLLVLLAALAPAETVMLLVDERLDGEPAARPLASLEGLMAGMFEAGFVTFDPGPYQPEADWERQQFAEPLELARDGAAHYLATVRVESRTLEGGEAHPPAVYRALAAFCLWQTGSGQLLGRGELALDNQEREREVTYQALLFETGERVARELARLARPSP